MHVSSNVLTDDDGVRVPVVPSPNASGALRPEYLVMHFTAGRDAASSIRWLTSPDAKASAHLVIGRDGAATGPPLPRAGEGGVRAVAVREALPSRLSSEESNALWFGEDVSLVEAAEIARELVRNGVELQYFGWFEDPSKKANRIEIGTSRRSEMLDILEEEDINKIIEYYNPSTPGAN